tara:strand:+ start:662 stop:1153 length:492 start_codon:yes stop_codon:yes gene_type:complete
MISQAKLKELFIYNKDSGIFTRIVSTACNNKVGDVVGSLDNGYLRVKVDGKNYRLHRLAFLYVTGEMPEEVDHLNHVRSDNRWVNLREASDIENSRNKSISKSNTSGVIGVFWAKDRNRWRSQIMVDNKTIWLGQFAEFSDAVNARKNAEVLYGFHENHGGAS